MSSQMPDDRPRPVLPRDRILVAVTDPAGRNLRYARDYGIGVEMQVFSMPEVLSTDFRHLLKRMASRLALVKGPIGYHGAFVDTVHYSPDREVMRTARMRYLQSMDLAESLGARYVLFHSQYNPLIRLRTYPEIYHGQSLLFWPDMIDEAARRGLTIYVENMFDDSPGPLRRLADAVDSPCLKLCLDVSHCALHSNLDVEDWIAAFGPHLRHVHLNDCKDTYDDHLGLGQGVLDLPRIIRTLKQTRLPLTYALETNEHTRVSLQYLGLTRKRPRRTGPLSR